MPNPLENESIYVKNEAVNLRRRMGFKVGLNGYECEGRTCKTDSSGEEKREIGEKSHPLSTA